MKHAVILERDGILNRVPTTARNQIQPLCVDEFIVNEETIAPLLRMKDAGFLLLVTTNQPNISRGGLSRRDLDIMHQILRQKLPLDDIFVCPHDEADRCPCRKPKTGLLLEAAFKWHLDLDHCFVVSDKWQDADAAQVTGCTSILVHSPLNGSGHHDFVAPTFEVATNKILQLAWQGQTATSQACVA